MTQNKRRELATRIKKETRNFVEQWLSTMILMIAACLIEVLIQSQLSLSLVIKIVVLAFIGTCVIAILDNIIIKIRFYVNEKKHSNASDRAD